MSAVCVVATVNITASRALLRMDSIYVEIYMYIHVESSQALYRPHVLVC